MPIKIIDGDLFDTKAKYICHQVNCKGKMGSGVAKQVRQKYPEAYGAYMDFCNEGHNKKDPFWTFGHSQFVECDDGKIIVNMFAQSSYGYDGKLYTDYAAFHDCLAEIRCKVPEDETVAMPFKIGCGLGGGDWDIVLAIINTGLPKHTVELWRKEGSK